MLTNSNKGTYLVKKWQKYANVIYEQSLSQNYFKILSNLDTNIPVIPEKKVNLAAFFLISA